MSSCFVIDSECHIRGLAGVPVTASLTGDEYPRTFALLATFIATLAPCRADKDVAVGRLPRPVRKAIQARCPPGHILEAEFDSEGYYEIKVENSQDGHLLYVRPKGKIFKDELD